MYLCILVMTCLSIQIAGEHFMPYVCTYIKKKALLDNSHWQMHLTYLSFVKQIFTLIKYTYIHEWLNRLWRYKINWLHRQIYLEYIFQGTENLTSRNEQHLREKGFRQEIRFNSPTFFKCIKSFTFSMNILLSKRLAFFLLSFNLERVRWRRSRLQEGFSRFCASLASAEGQFDEAWADL
jgi:hypothetical protein